MTTPRTGKYCPRCQTMTVRDQALCANCGHQFRTGVEEPSPIASDLHRTMQFTLPPLPVRAPTLPPDVRPRGRMLPALAGLALLFGLAGIGVRHLAPPAAPSPAGTWERALAGSSPGSLTLTLRLRDDGTGQFGWRENGAAQPLSGQSPLRWHRDAAGALALQIAPSSDPVSGTMISLFNGHLWTWRVDRAHGRLTLGNLVFTEKE